MPASKVLYRLYAILYKRATEGCRPYPIAHVMLAEGMDPVTILDDPPKSTAYPRYKRPWLKMGAPVKQVSVATQDPDDPTKMIVDKTPGMRLIYLQPPLPTPAEKKATVKGATKRLAQYFVSQCLGRAWTAADYGGQHMAQAKKILALGYTVDQVIKCLERLERGDLTDGVPWVAYTQYHNFKITGWSTLLCVLWGEPPSIEREPSMITNLNMTPEQWTEWRETRKQESLILDEPEEVTAARDFSQAPVWAKKGK